MSCEKLVKCVFAHYDTRTKRIVNGGDRDSYTYLHEYRHYLQDKAGILKWCDYFCWGFEGCSIVMLIIGWYFGSIYLLAVSGLIWIPFYIFKYLIVELDAYIYALMKKWRKNV